MQTGQNPERNPVRYGRGHEACLQVEPCVVGDDKQLCFSHAGNTLIPVPFSPSFLSPLLLPLFFYALSIEKENEQLRGFLLTFRAEGFALT